MEKYTLDEAIKEAFIKSQQEVGEKSLKYSQLYAWLDDYKHMLVDHKRQLWKVHDFVSKNEEIYDGNKDINILNQVELMAYRKIRYFVESLIRKQNVNDWIPVQVRKPEKGKYDWVLVCEQIGLKPRVAEYRDGHWHTDCDCVPFETWFNVRYWKPIDFDGIQKKSYGGYK